MIILFLTLLKKELKNIKVIALLLSLNIFYFCVFPNTVFSQGITVSAGSTLNVNNGTLNVPGEINIQGTLQATTGTIKLTGNWSNSGTYTMNTSTVNFTGPSGTQTLDSGGIAVGKGFYDLIHSGAGILQLTTNNVDIEHDFNNSAGTFDLNGEDITIAGDWTSSAAAVVTDTLSSSTVTFDGTDQNMNGTTNAFYNLTKIGTDSLTLDSTGEQIITGTLTLQGTGVGSELTLNSDDDVTPTRFMLNLQPGGLQSLIYLDVSNGDATGLSLVAVDSIGLGQNNDDLEEAPHWIFGAADITWQGDIDSDWADPRNWDLGIVPGAADTAIIPDVTGSGGSQPSLTADVSIGNITIQTDAIVDMNGHNMSISAVTSLASGSQLSTRGGDLTIATLSNEGTIQVFGYEAVDITTLDVNTGTFEYTGDSDGINEDFTLPDYDADPGDADFYNLVINSTVSPDRFRTNGDLVVAGSLTITASLLDTTTNANDLTVEGNILINGGTLTATSSNVDANGNVEISSGTLTAPDGTHDFNVEGDFTHSGGTFTNSSGTVTFDGTGQEISADGTTFYGFNKSVTSADTLTFDSAVTTTPTITGSLVLTGSDGNILNINSNSPGDQAPILLQAGATQILEYLQVRDSDASGGGVGGVLLVARNSTEPDGNNTNWDFDGTEITWQGDDLTTPTDWDTAQNWDLGIVPGEMDTAIITNVLNDPVLADDIQIENLTVNADGILYLDGHDIRVDDTLSNEGTISATGSETIDINTFDTDSGTFIYTGNDDGIADSFDIADTPSPNEYYDLIINDTNATSDTFVAVRDITVHHDLNVTDGTLDVSTNSVTLTTTNTLTVDGGTLNASNGNVDANYDVVLSSGTFIAPTGGNSFTIARNFDRSGGGTFTNSSGKVVLDSALESTIIGDTTFYDIECTTAGKQINFTAGSNQTVLNEVNFYGANTSDEVVLRSTIEGTRWDITLPNSEQAVQFLDVQDSNANTNDIYCFSCTGETQNNNDRWIFMLLAIEVPETNKTIDTTPTIIGVSDPGQTITIKDIDSNTVATVVSDANGHFRVEIDESVAMALGANSLTPYIGLLEGPTTLNLTVVDDPTTDQVPSVTSHSDGDRLNGSTPTITGKGLAGSTVTIKANDANGNLLLQTVGTGTVDGSGDYSIELTTPLVGGINYFSVTIDGVASTIIDVALTDPYGVVFNSGTNDPINNAVVTLYRVSDDQPATVAEGDLHPDDVNPVTTGEDGFYSFIAADGDYYIIIESPGYDYPSVKTSFPAGRSIITGSKGEHFTVSGVVLEMDHPMDSNNTMFRIVKDANKKEVTVGGVVTYSITIESLVSDVVSNVFLEDKIPAGFKYIDGRVILDGMPISDPSGNRPVVFTIGDFNPGQIKTLKYQLVVGSGVTMGNYNNTAFVKNTASEVISNNATETVKIVMDPLFDLGTVIGKVFFDENENGVQDAPEYVHLDRETIEEKPVPHAKIVMEDGTVITADNNGRFSVPSLIPGRHLFRLDERSLPEGAYLTTDKVVIVDITPGLLAKVNFGVSLDYDSFNKEDSKFFTDQVNISHDMNKPKKNLNVSLFGYEIVVFNDIFIEKAEFRIFTNYSPVIGHWKFEIVDDDTNKMIKSFEGNRFNIFDPIYWDGRDYKGNHIRTDRKYVYRLYVEDSNNNYDITNSVNIDFKVLEDEEQRDAYLEQLQETKDDRVGKYKDWVKEEDGKSNYFKENIVVNGETIHVKQLKSNIKSIRVMKDGNVFADIPVKERNGFTARELIEGNADDDTEKENDMEFILPKGDYEIVVKDSAGDISYLVPDSYRTVEKVAQLKEDIGENVNVHSKSINVGEDYVFFVGMGDAKVGYNFNKGDLDPIEFADNYKDGFYVEGKLAYYLKGKIFGKYLITSSYDSDRDKKELFKSLDKDKYYPVYGDDSSIDYSATDTQGNLYLLVEWDKSSAIWGNYSVGFDDTEFASFSRTLYGGKVDFESLSTTKYGDAKTKAVVFRARAQQKSAHNEFLATGGSLYFLKNKDIIEGSDKITIEVRDKVTGLVVSSREMKEGADYEIDYDSGRVVFWKPVPMLVDSYSIISSELLDGNLVYVTVDYEYDIKDDYDEANVGFRVRQALTDEVLVGATYVKEEQEDSNYELKGTDVTVHLGKDATVTAEYAESESEAQGSFISTDGGLSFTELATGESTKGRAYGIKGDAKLFNRLGVSSYYKWIDNDFSASSTSSQQGKELSGVGLVYDITDNSRVTIRHDIQSLIDSGNAQTRLQVGAVRTATTLIQMIHEDRKLRLTGEYRKQEIIERDESDSTQTKVNEDILAVRADYEVNEKLILSLEQQLSMDDSNSNMTATGIIYKPTDNLTLNAEQAFGDSGVATDVSVTADMSERLSITGGYAAGKDDLGQSISTVSLGADVAYSDKLKFHSTLGVAHGQGSGEVTSITLGGSSDMDGDTKLESELTLSEGTDSKSSSLSFGGTSKIDDKTTSEGKISVLDSSSDGAVTSYTFGTTTKINNELEMASVKTFGRSLDGDSAEDKYSITRTKNGKKLEGSLARKYEDNESERSASNIFGLSGDINDKVAFTASLERGDVLNHDGTMADRNAVSLAFGYVDNDDQTGRAIKSSTKLEARFDDGNENKKQYLMYHSLEGKINEALTVFNKMEFSKTRNTTSDYTEERHREFMIGAAYRPVMHDYLNFLGRYTYIENQSPSSQDDIADVLAERAHVISAEGVYDINPKWQVAEKFSYRISEEKVEGFDFTKTHTWLMIHRLNYNIDLYWSLGGEFRLLSQKEAKDMKKGFLIEASRRLGDYAQVGLGYNFTDFNDDLTELNYTSQGPFVRLTGKLYDRTTEELSRARDKWLEERINKWAWVMVEEEIRKKDSPVIETLNDFLYMARKAYIDGRTEEARQIYKDIIIAGQMMLEEAKEYIRSKINKEDDLKNLRSLADQYIKNGEYEKAKKILEKIMADLQLSMVE